MRIPVFRIRLEQVNGTHKSWVVRYRGRKVATYRRDRWDLAIHHVSVALAKFGGTNA